VLYVSVVSQRGI